MYVEFRCYIIINNREIYGPFTPKLSSPSDPTMPSAHAEVVAIKYVQKIKKNKDLKDATLALVRWTTPNNTRLNDWILADGVPCQDCVNFIKKTTDITKFIISSSASNDLIKASLEDLEKNTKKSTGRLFGR